MFYQLKHLLYFDNNFRKQNFINKIRIILLRGKDFTYISYFIDFKYSTKSAPLFYRHIVCVTLIFIIILKRVNKLK